MRTKTRTAYFLAPRLSANAGCSVTGFVAGIYISSQHIRCVQILIKGRVLTLQQKLVIMFPPIQITSYMPPAFYRSGHMAEQCPGSFPLRGKLIRVESIGPESFVVYSKSSS